MTGREEKNLREGMKKQTKPNSLSEIKILLQGTIAGGKEGRKPVNHIRFVGEERNSENKGDLEAEGPLTGRRTGPQFFGRLKRGGGRKRIAEEKTVPKREGHALRSQKWAKLVHTENRRRRFFQKGESKRG